MDTRDCVLQHDFGSIGQVISGSDALEGERKYLIDMLRELAVFARRCDEGGVAIMLEAIVSARTHSRKPLV